MTTKEKPYCLKEKQILIKPSFSFPKHNASSFSSFVHSIQNLISETLEKENLNHTEENFYEKLDMRVPLVLTTPIEKAPSIFSFVTICGGEHAQGLTRFIPDMLSRWLIPGKQIALDGCRSLLFTFTDRPQKQYYIVEHYVSVADEKDEEIIRQNLEGFIENLRINILSVYNARHIIELKKLSLVEKSVLIQENIASLLKRNEIPKQQSAFEQMHDLFIKIASENKLTEIQENVKDLLNKRPKSFDRDIFDDMHIITSKLSPHFAVVRSTSHISQLIGFQYLFKKTVKKKLLTKPKERHISIKLLKTTLKAHSEREVLGILLSFNYIRETEKIDKPHLLKTIRDMLSDVQYVPDSYLQDRQEENIRSIYFEIEKNGNIDFLTEEISLLQRKLPLILKSNIESVVTPIFMPRNEEEILRNVIFLSNQLKLIRDLPQVIISFDKQTGKQIAFTIILARVAKPNTPSIKELFYKKRSFLKFIPEEVKQVGFVKKKFPKEANIFRVYMKKTPFYRKDNSLDLQKARRTVVAELTDIIGEFRDNNGGLIQKQSQAFDKLREKLGKVATENEFLLENLFYSIKPAIMQSVMDIEILKEFFRLFLKLYKEDFSSSPYHILSITKGQYFIVMIGSLSISYKEELSSTISNLKIPSLDLTESSIELNNVSILGYVLKSKDLSQRTHFYSALIDGLKRWKENVERSRLLDL